MSSVFVLIVIVAFFAVLLPILAIIDLLGKEFSGSTKIVWVLVILFFPILGSILYFFLGKNQRISRDQ